MGMLLGGVPGVRRHGRRDRRRRGRHACRADGGRLGADIVILDRSLPRLRVLDEMFLGRVRTRYSTLEAIEEEVLGADVVIGAVLVPGASAPKLVTRAHARPHEARRRAGRRRDRPGRLLRDVAADDPCGADLSVDGIVHYCVANMPGAVPVTSSHALNNATLPFGLALAGKGIARADRGSASARRPQRASRAASPTARSPTARICPRRRPRKFWRREARRLTGENRPRVRPGRADEAAAFAAAYRQRS